MNASEAREHTERSVAARDAQFTIGQVARLTGVNAKTIRYYESVGLLPAPARSENSYRRYSRADVNRLMLLQRIRSLGMPLPAARSLLAGTDEARCTEVRDDLLVLMSDRLQDIDRQMMALQAQRAEVERYQRTIRACLPDPDVAFSACGDLCDDAEPPEEASCALPDCLAYYASCGAEDIGVLGANGEHQQFAEFTVTHENEEHHERSTLCCAVCCA